MVLLRLRIVAAWRGAREAGAGDDARAQAQASQADGKVRTFIYTSGVWVLGRAIKAAEEDAPLDPPPHVAWRPAHEDIVLSAFSATLRTVVVRPGIVYGGGRGIVADLIKDALNGLVRVVGPGKNRWPLIYDHDLGELYVRILETPTAAGIFHANDEADERVGDIVEAIAAHVPQKPDIRFMPMDEAHKKLGTLCRCAGAGSEGAQSEGARAWMGADAARRRQQRGAAGRRIPQQPART